MRRCGDGERGRDDVIHALRTMRFCKRPKAGVWRRWRIGAVPCYPNWVRKSVQTMGWGLSSTNCGSPVWTGIGRLRRIHGCHAKLLKHSSGATGFPLLALWTGCARGRGLTRTSLGGQCPGGDMWHVGIVGKSGLEGLERLRGSHVLRDHQGMPLSHSRQIRRRKGLLNACGKLGSSRCVEDEVAAW